MTDLHTIIEETAPATFVTEEFEGNEPESGYGRVYETAAPSVSLAYRRLAAVASGISVMPDTAGNDIVTAAINQVGVGGGGTGNGMLDPTIQAMMIVSEYYTITNGDLWQFANIPLQLGFNDDFQLSGDSGAVTDARAFLDDIHFKKRLEEIWLARYIYGQAYPIWIMGGRNKKRLDDIIVPNSKHIAQKGQRGIGARKMVYAPSEETTKEVQGLAHLPGFIVRPVGTSWNEPIEGEFPSGFELDPKCVTYIHVPKLANSVYAIPLFARAMNHIDARADLEEMAQATIKGFRNQLWTFLVDKPKRGEVAALKRELGGNARTGLFIWGNNIEVEQHTPKSLDELLGLEAYWRFTMNIYRDLGITPRVVAGESPNQRSSSGDSETDISVYLDRLVYDLDPFRDFTQRTLNIAFGDKAPRVTMPDIELKIANRIKGILVPLMNFGLPSLRTSFQKAGLDPEIEMEQHKQDWDFREKYIFPYTGFSQAGPTGVTDSPSGGRPAGTTETKPRSEKAEGSSTAYINRVTNDWNLLANSPDETHVRAFVLRMFSAGALYRDEAYRAGYRTAGGRGEPNRDLIEDWISWDEQNLDNFQNELMRRVSAGEDISGLKGRALLYPVMGYRMAYVAGLFQARGEQGYTGWQRVLNPGGSETGPCPVCVADARNVHSMGEPFFDHPNGVCGMRAIRFYSGNVPGGPTQIPIVALDADIILP